MTPSTIGRYTIEREIGHGGMSVVYLARDTKIKRLVALKVLSPQFIHDPLFRARFKREAELIAELEHPHIVSLYDFGEEAEHVYIVMRYMPGGTLRDRLQANGPLALTDLQPVLYRVAEALTAAHAHHIIHRDLKPANILFDARGEAYLSDFSIAKSTEATAYTGSNSIIGTPEYMSPEQARGEKVLDARSDIYSLGVVFFHALTGQLPFKSSTPMGAAVAHITDPVPNILAARPDLPNACATVVNCVLAKAPEQRYATALAFAEDVARTLQGLPLAASVAPVVVAGGDTTTLVDEGLLTPHRASALKQLRRLRGHDGPVTALSISPDSLLVASGSLDKTTKVWDLAYGRALHTFYQHTDAVRGVAYSPDGRTVISGSRDNTLIWWNTVTGTARRATQIEGSVSSVAYSPDGKFLAVGSHNMQVYLFEAETGASVRVFPGHTGRVSSVAFSPDGRMVASGSLDGTVRLWSAGGATGRLRPPLEMRRINYIWSVAFSPDGRWLAAGADSTILLWDWSAGTAPIMLGQIVNTVSSVAFSPDGRLLASGDAEALVRLWDPTTGQQLTQLRGHVEEVTSVAFSPDNRFLVSGSSDYTISLWGLRDL